MRKPLMVIACLFVVVLTSCAAHPTTTPAADTHISPTTGSSPRIIVTNKCPSAIPVIPKTASPDTHHPAPTDATAGVLCYYPGLNARNRHPYGPIPLRHPAALAALLNQATPFYGETSCPMDDASMDVVSLTPAVGNPVVVEIPATGCRFAVSTIASAAFQLTPAALRAIDALNPRPVAL